MKGMLRVENSEQCNEVILDMIHTALQKWKKAEYMTLDDDVYILKNRNRIRAEALKSIYLELLKEAKKRDISLSSEQLLDRILYTYDE